VLGYVRPLYLEVYKVEPVFDVEKLDVMYVYPCLNMLTVVCHDILKVGAESSMMIQL
jgi:hypothetical protein